MKKTLVALAALASLGITAPGAASAAAMQYTCGSTAPYNPNYQFTQLYAVRAIAKYNQYAGGACGGGISNSNMAPVGTSTVTEVFAQRDPITRALLLGITTDLPGDPEEQQHLVLFTNNSWAARAVGIAFGTLFPTSNEAALIAALDSLASGTGSDADYTLLGDFGDTVSRQSPNGDAAFALGDTFTSIAFSDGQIIGSGISFATPAAAAVPEPATWALMILGFGSMGIALRRRRAPVLRPSH